MTLAGNAFVYVTVTPVNEFPPVFTSTSYQYNVSELLNSKQCTKTTDIHTDHDMFQLLTRAT